MIIQSRRSGLLWSVPQGSLHLTSSNLLSQYLNLTADVNLKTMRLSLIHNWLPLFMRSSRHTRRPPTTVIERLSSWQLQQKKKPKPDWAHPKRNKQQIYIRSKGVSRCLIWHDYAFDKAIYHGSLWSDEFTPECLLCDGDCRGKGFDSGTLYQYRRGLLGCSFLGCATESRLRVSVRWPTDDNEGRRDRGRKYAGLGSLIRNSDLTEWSVRNWKHHLGFSWPRLKRTHSFGSSSGGELLVTESLQSIEGGVGTSFVTLAWFGIGIVPIWKCTRVRCRWSLNWS